MAKELNPAWFYDCENEEQKKKREQLVRNSTKLLDTLDDVVTNRLAALTRRAESRKAYEDPNWAFLQADTNGYVRALQFIRELIEIGE